MVNYILKGKAIREPKLSTTKLMTEPYLKSHHYKACVGLVLYGDSIVATIEVKGRHTTFRIGFHPS